MGLEDYLYKYTSLDSLALILQSRKIRLNPLDKMDDLQEQKTADVDNFGKFVFISSWTEDSTESIPMWRMYTDPRAGVRIKMRRNPFVWHGTKGKDIAQKTGMRAADDQTLNGSRSTFLDFSELIGKEYYSPQAWSGKILEQVIYTDEIEKLEPRVSDTSGGDISLAFDKMGKYKSQYWSFQKEWRYIMTFIPFSFKGRPEEMLGELYMTVIRILQGIEPPPFRFYDLDIAPEAFGEMEITRSPQMSPGNRVLLDALVEKYNPNAKIIESNLWGKI